MFRSISYKRIPGTIARINRNTGDLILNPEEWAKLSPSHRDFVLLHEEGHYKLQTPSEFEANNYAVAKYIEKAKFTDDYGHRIVVMSDLIANGEYSDFAVDPVSAISNAVGSIFNVLPNLGIGTKARIKEAKAQEDLIKLQAESNDVLMWSKTTNTIVIISVVALISLVIYIVYAKMKRRK